MKRISDRRAARLEAWRFGKKVRALLRERRALWRAITDAPVLPLEEPYFRGWDRWFEWSPEARRRRDFAEMEGVLELVQRREWSRFRDFRGWHPRTRKVSPRRHKLRKWSARGLLQACRNPALCKYFETSRFRAIGGMEHLRSLARIGWGGPIRFRFPELLVSRVEPHLVTHRRVVLPEAEARLEAIEAFLDRHGGGPWIDRLLERRKWKWGDEDALRRRGERIARREMAREWAEWEIQEGRGGIRALRLIGPVAQSTPANARRRSRIPLANAA